MKKVRSVDEYLEGHPERVQALRGLRKILCATELDETIKWGGPCYTLGGKTVAGIGAFKAYVGIWFHQGVFLKDVQRKLINAGEGKTKGLRQWRFVDETEIDKRLVKAYVLEAIENEKQGKRIGVARGKTLQLPEELRAAFVKRKQAKQAFEALTPGRQREYAEYVAAAKREATRISRTQKVLPMIESGVGINDKYR